MKKEIIKIITEKYNEDIAKDYMVYYQEISLRVTSKEEIVNHLIDLIESHKESVQS